MRQLIVFFLISIFIFGEMACKKSEDDTPSEPIPIIVPAVPIVNSPYEGDRYDNNCLFLLWEKVDFATEYIVQVANNDLFSLNGSLVFEEELDSARSSFIVDLRGETTGDYYFRMRAKNGKEKGAWTEPIFFQVRLFNTVNCSNFNTPLTPRPIAPEDSVILNETDVVFRWTHTINADNYSITVWSLSDSTNYVHKRGNITKNEYIIQSMPLNADYYWQVKAFNALEESAWSESRVLRLRQ